VKLLFVIALDALALSHIVASIEGLKQMTELQMLIEKIQRQTGSRVIDLRYRPEVDAPNWAVLIDWGNQYMAVVPTSLQDNPIDSLANALAYLEHHKAEH
jgi:hypothetical protein